MDIYSKAAYPSNALSNFAAHPFYLDGVFCAGMEGFLQSLKYKNPEKQKKICLLTGYTAKKAGKRKYLWKWTKTVWWQGKKYRRNQEEFQVLLDRAYEALFRNKEFRKALRMSGTEPLTHSIGTKNPNKTILTEEEFISRLLGLRERLLPREL